MSLVCVACTVLWYVILPLIVIFGSYIIAVKRSEFVRKKAFALFYEFSTKDMNASLIPYKKELFGDLNSLKKTQKRQSLTILELGAGPGANFEFYPENSKIIVVEPNRHFESIRKKNLVKWPTLILEKTVVGGAEDMSEIEDNSVDAVVDSLVLCSVNDIGKIFKEIHRILKPGGKYYFLEHGNVKATWFQRFMHSIFHPTSNEGSHGHSHDHQHQQHDDHGHDQHHQQHSHGDHQQHSHGDHQQHSHGDHQQHSHGDQHQHDQHHKKEEFDQILKNCGLFTSVTATVKLITVKRYFQTATLNITFGSAQKPR